MALFAYGEYRNEYEAPDNLVEIFEESVRRYGDHPLIGEKGRDGVYQWATYGQIGQRVDHLRAGLAALGVKAGDSVGIIANNRTEWLIAEIASQGLGAAYVPMYEKELLSMWRYVVKDAEIKVLLVSRPEVREKVKSFPREIPTLRQIVLIEGEGEGSLAALERLGAARPVPSIRPKPTEIAILVYTSGTTGEPKGVLLTHGNLTENVKAALAWFPNVTEKSRSISILPWAHAFGITADLHAFMMRGGSIGIMGSVETLADDLLQVRPTFMIAVPRIFNKVYNGVWAKIREAGGVKLRLFELALAAARRRRETGEATLTYRLLDRIVFKKIRDRFGGRLEGAITGSAPMNVEIAKFFIDVGIPTYDAYGMSEASPAITLNSPAMGNRLGSVGRPVLKTRVVIDRSRTEEGSQEGEILCFGPQCMAGYHKKPDKTREMIVERQGMRGIRTGDRGYLDDDGFLFITGRFKEEYKLANGKYIHPETVEQEMKLLPWILNAAVNGAGKDYNVALIVPDMTLLKRLAGELQLSVTPQDLFAPANPVSQKFKDLLVAEVQNHLRKSVGSYEIPRKVAFVFEDFTVENGLLTQTMKLKRRAIMERYGGLLERLYRE